MIITIGFYHWSQVQPEYHFGWLCDNSVGADTGYYIYEDNKAWPTSGPFSKSPCGNPPSINCTRHFSPRWSSLPRYFPHMSFVSNNKPERFCLIRRLFLQLGISISSGSSGRRRRIRISFVQMFSAHNNERE